MDAHTPTREEAMALIEEFNSNENLIKHAIAVEAVMRYMARKCGEDEGLGARLMIRNGADLVSRFCSAGSAPCGLLAACLLFSRQGPRRANRVTRRSPSRVAAPARRTLGSNVLRRNITQTLAERPTLVRRPGGGRR